MSVLLFNITSWQYQFSIGTPRNNIAMAQMNIKKINGYKINMDALLGNGAFGSVYKGEQDGTLQECAIKIIDKRKISKDPYLKSAMESEIQIMSKLKSPNIVRFFDVLMSAHNYYIVQELCDNDLEHFLEQHEGKKISEDLAITYLTDICNGFLALVKEGIIHRDLKPANILMSKGLLKICDFGFAKTNIHKKIKNQSCVGTPLYVSVQVLKSMGYTSKCDIWSIGCIFYEMLHGYTPWTAKSEYELVQAIQTKPLKVDQGLSEETKNFITRCLQIKEEDRICWDDLFKHPIFNGFFDSYITENAMFENKYKKVMSDLRFKINSQNIDLESLWSSLGFEYEKSINFSQFQSFLELINPNMLKCEQTYFFEQLDGEGSGEISIKQLAQELEKHQISTTSRYKNKMPLSIKKINTMNVLQVTDGFGAEKEDEEFEKRVRSCFVKLYKIIKHKGLSLYKTFMVYDRDSNGQLSVEDFAKILKKLDSNFSAEEVQAAFDLIDEDGSKTIEFEELNNYYCKVNCIPIESELPKSRASVRSSLKQNQFE